MLLFMFYQLLLVDGGDGFVYGCGSSSVPPCFFFSNFPFLVTIAEHLKTSDMSVSYGEISHSNLDRTQYNFYLSLMTQKADLMTMFSTTCRKDFNRCSGLVMGDVRKEP